jgi:S1-C subfamily serine protease
LLRLTDGSIVAPPQFESILKFSEGLAAARKEGKWGWINAKGEWIIQPLFEFPYPDASPVLVAGYFQDGLAYVGNGSYINRMGKFVHKYEPSTPPESTKPAIKSDVPNDSSLPRRMGSAFFIASDGIAITNAHVVSGCTEVADRAGSLSGRVVASDPANDLAILKFAIGEGQRIGTIRRTPPPQLGEEIVVFGFPMPGVLSREGVATTGSVNATEGLGGDSRYFQISAEFQRGNSGGPVLDRAGQVIGVAVSKLNALKLAVATGEIPQNVNFAIKADYLKSFLSVRGIEYREGGPVAEVLSSEDLASRAKAISLNIECIPMPPGR